MQSDTAVIVPARLDSRRLPNKALLPYAGRPLPHLLALRLEGFPLIFAIPDKPSDDPLQYQCRVSGIPVYRGPRHNPLKLVVEAAREYEVDTIVRATCDNPMLDRRGVEAGLQVHRDSDLPATCNLHEGGSVYPGETEKRTDPWGYFVDIAEREALEKLLDADPTDAEREHVTYGLKTRGKCQHFSALAGDQSRLDWSVDTAGDYRKMSRLFAECGHDVTPEQAVEWCKSVNQREVAC